MERDTLVKVGLSKLGHFYTNKVHLVYYLYQSSHLDQKQSALRILTEGMLYVWIGAQVRTSREEVLQEVQKQAAVMELPPKIVCITKCMLFF